MKVYITKYALSSGIHEKEAELNEKFPKMLHIPGKHGGYFYHKPYWHLTKEEAVAHAEELRVKKLASLQKQVAKLEKLTF